MVVKTLNIIQKYNIIYNYIYNIYIECWWFIFQFSATKAIFEELFSQKHKEKLWRITKSVKKKKYINWALLSESYS